MSYDVARAVLTPFIWAGLIVGWQILKWVVQSLIESGHRRRSGGGTQVAETRHSKNLLDR